jgi:hypothetical protein
MVPELWSKLDSLVNQGQLISHEIVYEEIVPEHGEKDLLAKWLETNKRIFIQQTQMQLNLLGDILKNFPKLIKPEYEKEQADPWLIASLIELMKQEGLFTGNSSYVLVSMENTRSDQKLPAACHHYNIRHMTLEEFFSDIKIRFKISSVEE